MLKNSQIRLNQRRLTFFSFFNNFLYLVKKKGPQIFISIKFWGQSFLALNTALYNESDIDLIYAYLLLLEGFIDFTDTSFLLQLTSAISYFLNCKMMVITPALKSHKTNENANNTIQFIRKLFLTVSELIFSSAENVENDKMLAAWRNDHDYDIFNFNHQGRNRSMPTNFLSSILIVLGIQAELLNGQLGTYNS
mgnify:CR=1 FL=1